jgi:hypothetical protein
MAWVTAFKHKIVSSGPLKSMLLVCLLMSGCNKDHGLDCFKGTGEIITESRSCGQIADIILYDGINLYIGYDTAFSLSVEGGEKLLPGVITESVGNTLFIRDENRCNWVRSFKNEINVYLRLPYLRKIEYRGTGNITGTSTLRGDTIIIDFWDASGSLILDVDCRETHLRMHTGCGDAEISGKTTNAYYFNRGNGALRCSRLLSEGTYIDAKCTNDSEVYASAWLFARITYMGNVYYRGNPPEIGSVTTERGRLIRLE